MYQRFSRVRHPNCAPLVPGSGTFGRCHQPGRGDQAREATLKLRRTPPRDHVCQQGSQRLRRHRGDRHALAVVRVERADGVAERDEPLGPALGLVVAAPAIGGATVTDDRRERLGGAHRLVELAHPDAPGELEKVGVVERWVVACETRQRDKAAPALDRKDGAGTGRDGLRAHEHRAAFTGQPARPAAKPRGIAEEGVDRGLRRRAEAERLEPSGARGLAPRGIDDQVRCEVRLALVCSSPGHRTPLIVPLLPTSPVTSWPCSVRTPGTRRRSSHHVVEQVAAHEARRELARETLVPPGQRMHRDIAGPAQPLRTRGDQAGGDTRQQLSRLRCPPIISPWRWRDWGKPFRGSAASGS